ncbi:hypothetical protein IWX49DRAFT_593980 [Phyllosticta citricarpa]|uniref:Uncharacterized protein n=2 Tax=Phyllosticta TaxID=121621 RepID=A0ABR1LK03_9PEZI
MSSLTLTDLKAYYHHTSSSDLTPHLHLAYRLYYIYEANKTTRPFPHRASTLRLFTDFFDPHNTVYRDLFTAQGKVPFESNDPCLDPATFERVLDAFMGLSHFEVFWRSAWVREVADVLVEREACVEKLRARARAGAMHAEDSGEEKGKGKAVEDFVACSDHGMSEARSGSSDGEAPFVEEEEEEVDDDDDHPSGEPAWDPFGDYGGSVNEDTASKDDDVDDEHSPSVDGWKLAGGQAEYKATEIGFKSHDDYDHPPSKHDWMHEGAYRKYSSDTASQAEDADLSPSEPSREPISDHGGFNNEETAQKGDDDDNDDHRSSSKSKWEPIRTYGASEGVRSSDDDAVHSWGKYGRW